MCYPILHLIQNGLIKFLQGISLLPILEKSYLHLAFAKGEMLEYLRKNITIRISRLLIKQRVF